MANRINSQMNGTRQNRRRRFVVGGLTFVTVLAFGGRPSSAQFRSGNPQVPYGVVMGNGVVMENPDDPAVKAKTEASQGMAKAMAEFRRAPGGDAKAAAQKKLLEALAKYFDADMKAREANLQKVEAQVKTLRSQFDKRASKKQEILDLQMKLLENETEGLGFFGSPSAGFPLAPTTAPEPALFGNDRYIRPPQTLSNPTLLPWSARPPQEQSVLVSAPAGAPTNISPTPVEAAPNETKAEPPKR